MQEEVSTFISFGHIMYAVVGEKQPFNDLQFDGKQNRFKIGSVLQSKLITDLNVDTL